jgi:hypothetical protein
MAPDLARVELGTACGHRGYRFPVTAWSDGTTTVGTVRMDPGQVAELVRLCQAALALAAHAPDAPQDTPRGH